MFNTQRRAAIVGVYTTEQARFMQRSAISLQLEAVKGALDDAGLPHTAVDGLIPLDAAPNGRGTQAHMFWAEQLGERPVTFMDIGLASGGGATPTAACSPTASAPTRPACTPSRSSASCAESAASGRSRRPGSASAWPRAWRCTARPAR